MLLNARRGKIIIFKNESVMIFRLILYKKNLIKVADVMESEEIEMLK